ncbi:MAG TPA: PilZ domain-containing protein [Candidatus Acidoferrum sp.]|nr:PilZ domain-containing protein [Candidatus Acidoferrum sp.]
MKVRSAVPDRRNSPRHFLRIPLRVRLWKSSLPEQQTISFNLSAGGAFFATELPVEVGTVLEIWLPMPQEITGEPLAEWRYSGHVVRISPEDSRRFLGVAIQFDCYEIARASESAQGGSFP